MPAQALASENAVGFAKNVIGDLQSLIERLLPTQRTRRLGLFGSILRIKLEGVFPLWVTGRQPPTTLAYHRGDQGAPLFATSAPCQQIGQQIRRDNAFLG